MHIACMGTHIHIRDFEDEYHSLLVAKANAKNVSLTKFLKDELKKIAKAPTAEAFGDMLVNLPREGNIASWSSEETAQIVREVREQRGDHLYRLAKRRSKMSK
jgi:tRNA/tmRNA/rRNA uracil-C5-methylase (TrmA/RlmC/RlmD family)